MITIIPPEIIAEAELLNMVERRHTKATCPVDGCHECSTLRILVRISAQNQPLYSRPNRQTSRQKSFAEALQEQRALQEDALLTFRRIIHDELGVPYDDAMLDRDPFYPIDLYHCPICAAYFCPEMIMGPMGPIRSKGFSGF